MSPEEAIKKTLRPGPCVYLLLTNPYLIRDDHGEHVASVQPEDNQTIEGSWKVRYSRVVNPTQPPSQVEAQSYIGSTNNILRRFQEHNGGKARATRGRKWILVALGYMPDLRTARHVEQWFKSGDTRDKKESLLRLWERHIDPDKVGALIAARVLVLRPLAAKETVE